MDNVKPGKAGAAGESPGVSRKSRLVLTLLAFFLGELGIHRFYAGKIGTGIVMAVLTVAGYATMWLLIGFVPLAVMLVWNVIDFVNAVSGTFKDRDGRVISDWQRAN